MQEHEKDKQLTAELVPLFEQLSAALAAAGSSRASPEVDAALAALAPRLTFALDFFEHHLTHEENRLSPVLRKNLNVPMMRETIQQVRRSRDGWKHVSRFSGLSRLETCMCSSIIATAVGGTASPPAYWLYVGGVADVVTHLSFVKCETANYFVQIWSVTDLSLIHI